MSSVYQNILHAFIHFSKPRHAVLKMQTHTLESPLWLRALASHTVQHRSDMLSVTLGHSRTYDSYFSEIMISLLKCLSGTCIGHLSVLVATIVKSLAGGPAHDKGYLRREAEHLNEQDVI